MRERAQRRDTKLMLWGIVALGAALRLVALGAKSFWLDEIASVVIARMPGNSFWHWLWTEEGNMALYYVMLRPWLEIHLGEATVRLLSVLPGVASLPVMYLLGKRLFGRNVGMLAALFLALSTCAVVYSQEARGYSWLLLGTIVSTYFFARLVARPTYAMACGYALAAGVTFYFHYFGLLVPLAHAVSLVALPKGRRPWKQLARRWCDHDGVRASCVVDDPHAAGASPRLGIEAVTAARSITSGSSWRRRAAKE